MNPSTPQVFVRGEEGSTCVDPRLTMHHPSFAELNHGNGMPARSYRYAPATPSQTSFDPSTHYTHSVGATSFTTPNDPPQETGSSSPAFATAGTLPGHGDIMKDVVLTGSWPDPIPNYTTLETLDIDENEPEEPQLPPSQDETVPAVIQPGTNKTNRLPQLASEIYETLMLMDSSTTECPPARLVRTQEQLHEIQEHISSKLQQPDPRPTVAPTNDPRSPNAPDGPKSLFKCRKCGDKAVSLEKFPMKRHVSEKHHPEFKYHCSECDFVNVRRHRLDEHIHKKHHRDPYPGEIGNHKEPLPCEPFCTICGCQVSSWRDFYSCFMGHCKIGGSSSNACSSRRPSLQTIEGTDDGANDDQSQLSPAAEDPRPAPRREDVGNPTQQFRPGSHTDASQYLVNATAAPNYFPGQQPPLSFHQVGGMAAPPPRQANSSGAPGNGRHLTPGDGHRRIPPFVQPQRPYLIDPRGRTRRPPSRARRPLRCNFCRHPFAGCRVCCHRTDTSGGCHRCPDRLGMRARTQAPQRRDAYGPTSAPRMSNLDFATRNLLGRPGRGFDPNAPNALGPGAFEWDAQGYYQDQGNHFNNFDQMGADIMGGLWNPPRRNNAQLRAVPSVDENVLVEQEMEHSPVLDLKTQPMGVLTSILPLIDPFKKWPFTPLKNLSRMALSGLVLITEEAPSATANSNPETECRCTCRCRTRTELAPGRRMEMSLEMSSADPSESTTTHEANSHHLRTRVQIVVKLLLLRSSVATSNRQEEDKLILEQAFAPTLGEMVPSSPDDESEDSETTDTESVFSEDDLSISSSCSDLQALSLADNPSTDDVVDVLDLIEGKGRREDDVTVMFDFDLHSALGKLSRWSGGSSDNISSDLSMSDPSHVLEYLTAYVLYVIMALARSGDHAPGPRLSQ